MNAQQLNSTLSFVGGRPMLILRDGIGGRIKVFVEGQWAFTVAPGHIAGADCEAVLVTRFEWCEDNNKWHEVFDGTWDLMSVLLSQYQQTGEFPCDIEEMVR